MIQIALDSNILIYLAGLWRVEADRPKIARAKNVIGRLRQSHDVYAPVQALGEMFSVLRRNRNSAEFCRDVVLELSHGLGTATSSSTTLVGAFDLVVEHKLQFWDALIVTAAAEAECTMLLSEDMQDGFVVRGLTIVNPLKDDPHPKLARLLASMS